MCKTSLAQNLIEPAMYKATAYLMISENWLFLNNIILFIPIKQQPKHYLLANIAIYHRPWSGVAVLAI